MSVHTHNENGRPVQGAHSPTSQCRSLARLGVLTSINPVVGVAVVPSANDKCRATEERAEHGALRSAR